MAQVTFRTTRDGKEWDREGEVVNAFCDSGLQMTRWKGGLYGVMYNNTGSFQRIYTAKWEDGFGFTSFRGLDAKYKPKGRCSVAADDTRFYLCYAGTNDKIYMLYTDDFETWNESGAIGWSDTAAKYAPTIRVWGDHVHIAHVGFTGRNALELAYLDRQGKILVSNWVRYPGLYTDNSLYMIDFQDKLYLFHTSHEQNSFCYQVLTGANWPWPSTCTKIWTPAIRSGVSATVFKDKLWFSYRGASNEVVTRSFDGETWSEPTVVDGVHMTAETGIGWHGDHLILSWGKAEEKEKKNMVKYEISGSMNEKSAVEELSDDEEWHVEWNQPKGEKSWIRKMFCL